jgi:succinoglycan biosynthesis protein ExoA
MTARQAVSVVLPIRNEADAIAACLDGIDAQTYPSDLVEVLVVDGMSTDTTRDIVLERSAADPRIRLIDNVERITPTALNAGIRAASHDVIVRMDGHSVPAVDYIEQCVRALEESDAWAVGGTMDRTGRTPAERAIARATSMPLGVGNSTHNYATTGTWVETVYLGTWRREVFERVGLFDPELVRDQDDELSYRIRAAGGRIWFDPRITCEYRPRPSLRTLFRQYREYACFKVRVFQKHPAAARWRHLVPPVFVAAGVTVPVVAIVTPLGAYAWIGLALLYLGVLAAGVAGTDPRGAQRWRVFVALVVLHLAYGIGFWEGLVRFAPRWFRDRRGSIPSLMLRERT